eukprot:Opistho-2@81050
MLSSCAHTYSRAIIRRCSLQWGRRDSSWMGFGATKSVDSGSPPIMPAPPTTEGWLTDSFPPQLTDPTKGFSFEEESFRMRTWMTTIDPYVVVPYSSPWLQGTTAAMWQQVSSLVEAYLRKKGSGMDDLTITQLGAVVAHEFPKIARRIQSALQACDPLKKPRDQNELELRLAQMRRSSAYACVSTALTRRDLGLDVHVMTPTVDEVNSYKMQTIVLVNLTIALAGTKAAESALGNKLALAGIMELMGACALVRFYSLVPSILRNIQDVFNEYAEWAQTREPTSDRPSCYRVGSRWKGHVPLVLMDLESMAAGHSGCGPVTWEDSHEMFFMGTLRLRLESDFLMQNKTKPYARVVARDPWSGGQSFVEALKAAHGAVFVASSQAASGKHVLPDALCELAAHMMEGVPGVVERNRAAAAKHLIEGWKRGSGVCANVVASGALVSLVSKAETDEARVVAAVMGLQYATSRLALEYMKWRPLMSALFRGHIATNVMTTPPSMRMNHVLRIILQSGGESPTFPRESLSKDNEMRREILQIGVGAPPTRLRIGDDKFGMDT